MPEEAANTPPPLSSDPTEHDPELKIAVREELSGGYFREIRNIRVEKQSATLFQVPMDYRLVEEQMEKRE